MHNVVSTDTLVTELAELTADALTHRAVKLLVSEVRQWPRSLERVSARIG